MDLSSGMAALGLIGFLTWLFIGAAGVVLTVLWIVTPFSVFAIRRRLDEQDALLMRIEGHLARIADTQASAGRPPPIA
ncbi:MAG TPA: hypothetical protein VMB50_12560 [Myxococcales bacterium]|nr:hypothetical protein [Myxococcales bacterium]